MNIPRFTLLQLLGAMTVCGVLFCIAAIDPIGSGVALLVFAASLLVTLFANMLTYLLTRIVSEMAAIVLGGWGAASPAAASPFAVAPERSPFQAAPVDLASAVESLQAETQRELGSIVIDAEHPENR